MKYKSCIHIERGIDFSRDAIKICCLSRPNIPGGTVVIPDYKGGMVDWEKFFSFKNEIKEMHKKGEIYNKCCDCIHLEEQEWTDIGNCIDFINVDHWAKCDTSCIYCYTMEDKKSYNSAKSFEILPVIKYMVKNNIITNVSHVSFGGGEVTLLKEFEKLLSIFLSKCNKNSLIRIHSSATRYSKTIEKGLKIGIMDLIVSLDSASEELHKKIKQVNTYKKVWKNLEKYAKKQLSPDLVKAKYIIIPDVNDNTTEIENFLLKCKDVGINCVIFEIEGGWINNHCEEDHPDIIALFDYAKNKAQELGMNFQLYDRAGSMMKKRDEKLLSSEV